jgi:small-conductance mechanosensitive channel
MTARATVRLAVLAALALLAPPAAPAEPLAPAAAELGAAPAPAAAPAPPADRPETSSQEAALVVLRRHVTTFRAPLFGVSPAERARRGQALLEERLGRSIGGKVTVQSEVQGKVVLLDGELVFFLVERDADRLSGETLDAATRAAVERLTKVIAETAEGRDHDRLLRSALAAALATLIFGALTALLVGLRRRVLPRLEQVSQRLSTLGTVGGAPLVLPDTLRRVAGALVLAATWLVVMLGAYRWLSYVMLQFPATRPWGEQLAGFFAGVAQQLVGGTLRALPDLVVAGLILLLARGVNGLLAPIFARAEKGGVTAAWLDADTAKPTRRIVSIAVWLFAVVMAYPYLPGSQSDAFKGMSVMVGLVVTFGGSSIFGQAASGLVLMYSRTVRVGEYVRVDTHEGTVTELGTFTTRIRTGLGEEVSLPNSFVLGTVTRNYSRAVHGKGFVVDTVVTIGYDTPWRQVEAMLIEAAQRTDGILAAPAPQVFQTELTDFYPQYRLVAQAAPTAPRPRAQVLSSLHANIQDVFNEHGVQIMSPHYIGDPSAAKVVPKARWYAAPASPPPAPGEGQPPGLG